MERLFVKFAGWPGGKAVQGIELSYEWFEARSVRRLGKIEFKGEIRANAYQEDAASILRNAKILRVQYTPFDPVARRAVTTELIFKQCAAFPVSHSVNIFDDKSFGFHYPQNSVEFTIKEIN